MKNGATCIVVFVKAARRILPWILHIDSRIRAAFNLSALHREVELPAGNPDHAIRSLGSQVWSAQLERWSAAISQAHASSCASGSLVIAAMRCIRVFIASLGSPGVARIAP